MNISSAPTTYSITSSNVDTISISNGGTMYSSNTPSFINGAAGNTITFNTGLVVTGASTWALPEEWVNSFPDYNRVQKMCEQYPGLKIVYEKFVTTYKLVKDDYDNPKDKA